jgi:hypothetical protein
MRSLVPLLLIVLACDLAGCAVDRRASPDTAFADSPPAIRASGIVVAQKPIGGADHAVHENCGGR